MGSAASGNLISTPGPEKDGKVEICEIFLIRMREQEIDKDVHLAAAAFHVDEDEEREDGGGDHGWFHGGQHDQQQLLLLVLLVLEGLIRIDCHVARVKGDNHRTVLIVDWSDRTEPAF